MSETPRALNYGWIWIFGLVVTLLFVWFLSYLTNLIPHTQNENMTQSQKTTDFSFHNELPDRQSPRQVRHEQEIERTLQRNQNMVANEALNSPPAYSRIQQRPMPQQQAVSLQQRPEIPPPTQAPTLNKAPVIITADPISTASIKPRNNSQDIAASQEPPRNVQPPSSRQNAVIGRGTVLQAGSFTSWDDADRRRAELAMLGLESKIQQVRLNSGGVWNRVIIGPFDDRQTFSNAKSTLRNNGIVFLQKRN